jgi:long-chain fatty acid transport protein
VISRFVLALCDRIWYNVAIMKTKSILLVVAASAALNVIGAGFALYEPSTVSTALGGALLGKGVDASANFNNPATLTDITNITVTVGFVTEHPRTRVKVNKAPAEYMDPGFFVLPHFQMAVPLPWDFTFGLGIAPEWGLGSQYSDIWPGNWNSKQTDVQGFVLNPNLAYKVTDKWSVGAGLRFLYFDFEQYSSPQAAANGVKYGTLGNWMKGDNGFSDFGFQVGTSYKVFDNFAVGVMYKSPIDVHVRGRTRTCVENVRVAQAASIVQKSAIANNGGAAADLQVPQSIGFGFNWDITDTVHLGAMASWTEWSCMDKLTFRLPAGRKTVNMDWEDTWRFSIAPSWDFAEDWTAMCSYVFDMDPTVPSQESTMLPPGNRHILTWGLAWRCWAGLELSLSYGIVLMDSKSMCITDSLGKDYWLDYHRGLSHAAGFSITYRF